MVPQPQSGGFHGKFDGTSNWEAFYYVFEAIGEANGWMGLVAALGGKARNCVLTIPLHERTNAVAVAAILDQQYGLAPYQVAQSTQLWERCRQPGESLGAMGNDIKALWTTTPAALREYSLLKEHRSLKKAIAEGRQLEQILETTRASHQNRVAAAGTDLGAAPSDTKPVQ
ncbi:UNVERIFIED_CONTAM: hypothetical protein FKN15_035591 [Acipenser sinensis]